MACSLNDIREEACEEVEKLFEDVGPDTKEALAYAREHVQVFRSLAVYLRKSAKAKNRILIERTKVQPDENVYFILDCPTRWNSCMDMLQTFPNLDKTVNSFFEYLSSPEGKKEFQGQRLQRPAAENWFVIRCLLLLLHPFKAVTEELSGGEYPTLPMTIPALRTIKQHLLKLTIFEEKAKEVKGYIFANDALAKMDKVRQTFLALFLDRFSSVASELTWITYLDPRLSEVAHLRPDEKIEAQEALVDAMIQLGHISTRSTRPAPRPPQPSNTPQKVRLEVRTCIFGSRAIEFDPPPEAPTEDDDIRTACQQEFEKYVEKAKSAEMKSDPLAW